MTEPAERQPSKPDDLTIIAFRPGGMAPRADATRERELEPGVS
jgi:hypothetical protein